MPGIEILYVIQKRGPGTQVIQDYVCFGCASDTRHGHVLTVIKHTKGTGWKRMCAYCKRIISEER